MTLTSRAITWLFDVEFLVLCAESSESSHPRPPDGPGELSARETAEMQIFIESTFTKQGRSTSSGRLQAFSFVSSLIFSL